MASAASPVECVLVLVSGRCRGEAADGERRIAGGMCVGVGVGPMQRVTTNVGKAIRGKDAREMIIFNSGHTDQKWRWS